MAFPFFSRLAPEIRNQIWREMLPDTFQPSLYLYRKRGCWCPRLRDESDPEYAPGRDELNWIINFRTDLLDEDNRFEMPLFFVNREAHSIALAWFHEKNIKIHPRNNGSQYVFAPPFDPKFDALYVTVDKWEHFCEEPGDRWRLPDIDGMSCTLQTTLTRIAVPEKLFWETELILWIPELERWFEHLQVLFIVMGSQPDDSPGLRWELKGAEGGAVLWDKASATFTFQKGSEDLFERAVYSSIEEVAEKLLRNDLLGSDLKSLEIRPVYTVRK